MNEQVIGKKIKLNDYNFTYGNREKILNVMCFFKYKKDNNLYVVCCDDSNIPYGIINYGTAHLKGNTLILIGVKEPKDEMLKELLYKIDNKEELSDFEIQDLKEIELIELVSPNKFEVKKEVLESVIDKTIPKPVVVEKSQVVDQKKKNKTLPLVLILLLFVGGIFYFFVAGNTQDNDNTVKSFICKKEYNNTELNAKVIEDNTYNFNQNDILEYINKSTTYRFYKEEDYLDFVNRGLYYSYISEDGGFTLDDVTYSLIVIEKEDVDTEYSLPKEYEEVISYNKKEGYSCEE